MTGGGVSFMTVTRMTRGGARPGGVATIERRGRALGGTEAGLQLGNVTRHIGLPAHHSVVQLIQSFHVCGCGQTRRGVVRTRVGVAHGRTTLCFSLWGAAMGKGRLIAVPVVRLGYGERGRGEDAGEGGRDGCVAVWAGGGGRGCGWCDAS